MEQALYYGVNRADIEKAYRAAQRKYHYDELIQEAALGILHAAELYDATRNVPFGYYAARWAAKYVQMELQRYKKHCHLPLEIDPPDWRTIGTCQMPLELTLYTDGGTYQDIARITHQPLAVVKRKVQAQLATAKKEFV